MNLKFLPFVFLATLLTFSCSDSASDEFDDANPDAEARYIETVTVVSAQDSDENATITVNYDANDRVSSITDGTDSSLFVYNDGDLSNITGQGDNLNIEELYQSPYDAFETGEITTYDNHGNPSTITFYETEYDFENDVTVEVEYTANISYDDNLNPYFYTMDAAGIIDVLDNVNLNLTMNASSDQAIAARMLLPLNNITGIAYSDEEGNLVYNIEADYVYNDVDYPVSGTVTGTEYFINFQGEEETEVGVFSVNYTYRE